MDRGTVFMLLSALNFALSTVFAKYAHLSEKIAAVEVTFFRFLVGFVLTALYVACTRQSLVPRKMGPVILRAVTNTAAVLLFYAGIELTTVSKANLLNMTYPAFVLFFAPLINREGIVRGHAAKLLVAGLGMYLVISPDFGSFNIGDLASLASGAVAGLSIAFVREAGKSDRNSVILFYLMAVGLAINTIFVLPVFQIPSLTTGILIFFSGLTGYLGQIFSTAGYAAVEASKGSLISTSRIVYSLVLGTLLFGDRITVKIVAGGLLLTASLVGRGGTDFISSLIRPGRQGPEKNTNHQKGGIR